MKIFLYCQHVLGMGHFFRALEICNALKNHDVVLVTGGSPVNAPFPDHVREIRLPPLMMDADFKGIYSPQEGKSVDEAKAERKAFLHRCFREEHPDVLIVELYPFGRKAFRFELDPVLEDIKNRVLPLCRVVCSLRDILVEKDDVDAYEKRVIKTLNRYFDALLVHADPEVLRLDETFSRMNDLTIPIHYTGFVAPMPDNGAAEKYQGIQHHQSKRQKDRRGREDQREGCLENGRENGDKNRQQGKQRAIKQILAGIGGGSVGEELLMAVGKAIARMNRSDIHLKMFTGPFMNNETYEKLTAFRSATVSVARFSSDYLNLMAASDLSISMGGYNTSMNILAANVPALVWPFSQNREQRLRAEILARKHPLTVLTDHDLDPERLAQKIGTILELEPELKSVSQSQLESEAKNQFPLGAEKKGVGCKKHKQFGIDLTGAQTSADIIESLGESPNLGKTESRGSISFPKRHENRK